MKMQKGAENGQTEGDDGRMKDDNWEETETTRRTGGTGGNAGQKKEGERAENKTAREAGAATKLASGKRPRDTYGARAALDMVRSGRLDEQGFEKFFADPPAALVVLKGLRKLAEPKVLLGGAQVPASRSATDEAGMKNAKIEANGEETQTTGPQEDRACNPIVGGENRSQVREDDFYGHG
jgi:hypothetical protein